MRIFRQWTIARESKHCFRWQIRSQCWCSIRETRERQRAKGMEKGEETWNEIWSTCSKHCTHCNNTANSSRRYWRKLRVKDSLKVAFRPCEEGASKEEDTRASFILLLRKVWVNNVAKLSACYGCSSFFCYMVPVFQWYRMWIWSMVWFDVV